MSEKPTALLELANRLARLVGIEEAEPQTAYVEHLKRVMTRAIAEIVVARQQLDDMRDAAEFLL